MFCKNRNVFTRKDFYTLADYDQVGRALLALTKSGELIRIGYGLYAKARLNRITNLPMVAAEGGFYQVAREALDLLGVAWEPDEAEKNYMAGSLQIPVNAGVVIKDKFNRKIGTEKVQNDESKQTQDLC